MAPLETAMHVQQASAEGKFSAGTWAVAPPPQRVQGIQAVQCLLQEVMTAWNQTPRIKASAGAGHSQEKWWAGLQVTVWAPEKAGHQYPSSGPGMRGLYYSGARGPCLSCDRPFSCPTAELWT